MSGTLVAAPVPMEVTKQRVTIDRSRGTAFEVKKWNAIAIWGWDIVVDNCAICRNHIMESCIGCQADQSNEDCIVAWGVCNHGFHHHCMSRWLLKKNACPLCNREWQFYRLGH